MKAVSSPQVARSVSQKHTNRDLSMELNSPRMISKESSKEMQNQGSRSEINIGTIGVVKSTKSANSEFEEFLTLHQDTKHLQIVENDMSAESPSVLNQKPIYNMDFTVKPPARSPKYRSRKLSPWKAEDSYSSHLLSPPVGLFVESPRNSPRPQLLNSKIQFATTRKLPNIPGITPVLLEAMNQKKPGSPRSKVSIENLSPNMTNALIGALQGAYPIRRLSPRISHKISPRQVAALEGKKIIKKQPVEESTQTPTREHEGANMQTFNYENFDFGKYSVQNSRTQIFEIERKTHSSYGVVQPISPKFMVINERLGSNITESRKCSSILGRSDNTPKNKRKDDVSEIGEHDLSHTLKRIENYMDSAPSDNANPLEDFKRSFWRNDLDSPLKLSPQPTLFSPQKFQGSPKFQLKATVLKKKSSMKQTAEKPNRKLLKGKLVGLPKTSDLETESFSAIKPQKLNTIRKNRTGSNFYSQPKKKVIAQVQVPSPAQETDFGPFQSFYVNGTHSKLTSQFGIENYQKGFEELSKQAINPTKVKKMENFSNLQPVNKDLKIVQEKKNFKDFGKICQNETSMQNTLKDSPLNTIRAQQLLDNQALINSQLHSIIKGPNVSAVMHERSKSILDQLILPNLLPSSDYKVVKHPKKNDSFDEIDTPIEARYSDNISSWKNNRYDTSGLGSSVLEVQSYNIKEFTKVTKKKPIIDLESRKYNFISKFIPSEENFINSGFYDHRLRNMGTSQIINKKLNKLKQVRNDHREMLSKSVTKMQKPQSRQIEIDLPSQQRPKVVDKPSHSSITKTTIERSPTTNYIFGQVSIDFAKKPHEENAELFNFIKRNKKKRHEITAWGMQQPGSNMSSELF